jgi:hypothetical protein
MLHIDNDATVIAANLTVYDLGTLTGGGFIETTAERHLKGPSRLIKQSRSQAISLSERRRPCHRL